MNVITVWSTEMISWILWSDAHIWLTPSVGHSRGVVSHWAWSYRCIFPACRSHVGSYRRWSGMTATWRSDSALSSKSSKNTRQWHFIRAEGSSNGSWRSRRALKPLRAQSTVVPLPSSGTQSSSTHCLWMRGDRNQCFVMGCPEQVQNTLMDGHVCEKAVVLNIPIDPLLRSMSGSHVQMNRNAALCPPVPYILMRPLLYSDLPRAER